MIEYAKVILPKVSFSRELFEKELRKCISWVEKDQRSELGKWCYEQFGALFPDILSRYFKNVAA
ncbi:MAG: hypothetical protein Q8862_07385 [Bacteroidota bacterium]|nr:hypothetical protein [Bacteroidota bacterium]MDP4205560.1 hypothetical protein [Bacteroidota bacterium]